MLNSGYNKMVQKRRRELSEQITLIYQDGLVKQVRDNILEARG